ncbi:MAG: response regulator transcription factor [Bdellovibrionaceae bacterium]|nr:response regulator transcription factor [Bdellovibrio sp.]
MRVLVIEDDKIISQHLEMGLQEAGYNVQTTADGLAAYQLALVENFDLLIVDVMLPGKDGFSIVEELRLKKKEMPVLFLSAKRSIEDRIEGLQRGGDDYLVKPFSFSELLARCQALLRRTQKNKDTQSLKYQDLEVDLIKRMVLRGDQQIELKQKEFALLEYLLRNKEQVLTKTQILEVVWHYDFDPQTNVVDVLVCRLRNKIDRGFNKKLIRTIRGVGYALRAE